MSGSDGATGARWARLAVGKRAVSADYIEAAILSVVGGTHTSAVRVIKDKRTRERPLLVCCLFWLNGGPQEGIAAMRAVVLRR